MKLLVLCNFACKQAPNPSIILKTFYDMVTIARHTLGRCKFYTNDEDELMIIHEALRVFQEGAIHSEKYKDGTWDGFYKFYDNNDYFDFGLVLDLKRHLKKNDVKYKTVDYYQRPLKNIVTDISYSAEPRFYQKEAVEAFFRYDIGIIIVPTRGGKTYISGQCIRNINLKNEEFKTAFFVDGIDLFNQTVKELAEWLEVSVDEIGTINSDGFNPKRVTVAMVQTVNAALTPRKSRKKDAPAPDPKPLRDMTKFLNSVSFLIVDEIQDNSSDKRLTIYRKCRNAKYILGLSATPFKQNNEEVAMKVKGFFGGTCYEIKKSILQEEGFLSIDKAILISNMTVKQGNPQTYQDFLKSCIFDNDKRNKILKMILEICVRNEWKSLFLFNSKYHGRKVSQMTGHVFIDGDNDGKEREKEKQAFLENKKGGILLASNIYRKGITLPEVELVVISDGGLEGTNVIQKFGRVLGVTETKKKSIVIDILDIGNKYFSEHSLNRLEIYNDQIGENRIEIYENENDEHWSDLEESIKEWLSENRM